MIKKNYNKNQASMKQNLMAYCVWEMIQARRPLSCAIQILTQIGISFNLWPKLVSLCCYVGIKFTINNG